MFLARKQHLDLMPTK